jgi:hypothetical protein
MKREMNVCFEWEKDIKKERDKFWEKLHLSPSNY